MALLMKLPDVVMNKGKFVFRKRIPVDLRHLYPTNFFETRFRVQEFSAVFVSEHAAYGAAYCRMVDAARDGQPDAIGKQGVLRYIAEARAGLDDPRTLREKWAAFKEDAEARVRAVRGGREMLDDGGDQERRDIIAEEIVRTGGDRLLYRAVTEPNAAPPPATLADAAKIYEQERLGENPKKSARNTFNKIKRRLEASLGPLDSLPLTELTREHARKVRDDLLATPKSSGEGVLSPASVGREINSIKALITVGITEYDLRGQAFNPFEKLSLPPAVAKTGVSEWELRDPLPDEVLLAVRHRVMNRVRVPELRLIWRLLQATGCRGAEITGLLQEDVVLDHAIPHLWVRWNEERQLKTVTSIRPVPLIGDGLEAAREALGMALQARQNAPALFPRYAREGGPDAVSGALMGHLRKETQNPRHVVYSLRHNVKAWLGQSDASERDEKRLLGHAEASVGNRYYGGLGDRLRGTSSALEAALLLAPVGAWVVK